MTKVVLEQAIDASKETVFRSVSEIENFPEIQADVLSIEFLTDQRAGVGTRFVETRRQGKGEMLTELEVTEWVDNERVRMVTDSHGTIWDTIFEVRPVGSKTELTNAMDARPHQLLPKIMNPLMKGFFRKGIATYLDQLREHCEAEDRGRSGA